MLKMVRSTLLALATLIGAAHVVMAEEEAPRVIMETSMGTIVLELDPVHAPVTTANFLRYVDAGFYDGLVFHRVIPGFMIQGGGYDAQLTPREQGDPIKNESRNGLANDKGTISMARTSDPHSAEAQFFINTNDNHQLDGRPGFFGYAVFGRVVDGMDTVFAIEMVPTVTRQGMNDVPREPVIIESVHRAP